MPASSSNRILACIRCSEKRVKCDRLSPCTTCVKQNTVCQYRPRKTRVSRGTSRQTPKKDSVESSQTSRSGVDLTKISEDHNGPRLNSPPRVLGSAHGNGDLPESQVTVFRPQLLQGQEGTKLVDNSLWSRIAEEIPREEDSAAEEAMSPTGPPEVPEIRDFSYVLGCVPFNSTKGHPTPTGIRLFYQTFVRNVDPLVKIIHVPTFQLALEKATTDLDHVPKAFEAFMFSMYSMAVLSMADEECMKSFKESRKALLDFFVGATKAALLQANFMSSTNLVVLQALTLHIFSIRHDHEPRAVWSLTGLTIRVAQVMGMSIDGSLLGLSPFETEIRRRIWWQLKLHDSRAAELCGQAKFQSFDVNEKTPRMPANINDSDLSPSMTHTPAVSIKPTEMIWNVMLAELANFGTTHKRKIKISKATNDPGLSSEEYSALDNIRGKDAMSEEIEELMETKYLRFCDPSKPLQMLTLVGTRCATDFIRFVAHHPRRWAQQPSVSLAENELVWNLCLQILDRTVMMQSMSRLQQFAWIVPYHIQWPVVIHVLDTLRTEPAHPEAEKAWSLIHGLCGLNADLLLSTDRPIFVAIGSLCVKAYRAKMSNAAITDLTIEEVPKYIAELEHHYQEARTKRSNVLANHRTDYRNSTETSGNSNSIPKSGYAPGELLDYLSTLDAGNEDSFWFDIGDAPDKIDTGVDPNYLTTNNYWLDVTDNSSIDWSQWDTWMGTNGPL